MKFKKGYFVKIKDDIDFDDFCKFEIPYVHTNEMFNFWNQLHNQSIQVKNIATDLIQITLFNKDWYLPIELFELCDNNESLIERKESLIEGYKESNGKMYYDIDWQFVQDLAELMFQNKIENGGKYERSNWKKDLSIQDIEDALDRHYMKYKLGYTDEEHDLAVCCNILMLRYLKRKQ